jgi:hypothetical protein
VQHRNGGQCVYDDMGMRIAIVGALLAAVTTGCGGPSSAAHPTPEAATPTTASISVQPSTSPGNGPTEAACLKLAQDSDLAEFWRQVPKGPQVTAPFPVKGNLLLAVRSGLRAVASLDTTAAAPNVQAPVAEAMRTAAAQAAQMQHDVDLAGKFDTRAFTAMVTPVVTACQDAGVDMAT